MPDNVNRITLMMAAWLVTTAVLPSGSLAAEPPVINPFGQQAAVREDTLPGYVELSDGTVRPGQIYLTRDKRLEINDQSLKRQREVPLRAVKQIECRVSRQWMEKQWKFKEAASSEKMYTGRTYPVREYTHRITLHDGRTITGPLSAIVYVQPENITPGNETPDKTGNQPSRPKAERYLLNKRAKGTIGDKIDVLLYVKFVKLGEKALAEGRRKADEQRKKKSVR